MLTNFIICGTQKAGTTALDSYLREHPQVCMANKKEVHFFDNERLFINQNPSYNDYHVHFTPSATHKVIGESTPIYMYWHNAPRRIWQYNSSMKLVVLLRSPIERAYSHWNMERARGAEHLPFWEAIIDEHARCKEALPYQHRVYTYIDRGYYLEQLRRLWLYFPKKNILILKSEDLKSQPQNTLNKVCSFLAIDDFISITPKESHVIPYNSNISDQERKYLVDLYENEVRGLEKVLDWDCSDWLTI